MKCKICSNETYNIFSAKILNKNNIKYFYCDYCGFLQTEEPYWLKEAYSDPICIIDTGIMARNITLSQITSGIICFLLFL
jgi:protein-arginine kinase activator protein McsA